MPVLQEQKPVSYFTPGFLPSTLRVHFAHVKIVPDVFVMHMDVLYADNAGAFIGHYLRAGHYQTINKKSPCQNRQGLLHLKPGGVLLSHGETPHYHRR